MDDEMRKLLMEYLGEEWGPYEVKEWQYITPDGAREFSAFPVEGGKLTYRQVHVKRRTFTTPDDMMALKDKLVEKVEFWGLDSFLDWADNKWDTMPDTEDNYPGNFIDWLMNPARFCGLVGEWLKVRG